MKVRTIGSVEKYLLRKIREEGTIHLTLIDPEKTEVKRAAKISVEAVRGGTTGILLGGSTIPSSHQVDLVIKGIKKFVKTPVILFPGNVSGISRFADAVFFMSLLNSSNPYFHMDAQALGAPWIKKYGIEPIPLGYIIMGTGGTAGFVGYARPIPYDKAELAASYALAAQYMGMRLVYLEAGSGAESPIPSETVSKVRAMVDIPLVVGGGIRTGEEAQNIAKAGANIIVTGTIVEEARRVREKIKDLVDSIKK